ncbi:MAG: hypothetical protein KGJ47_10125 [Acidobacteriota bacterium]|nr:hypothetical protein [Acidobacteriota bacterium]
MTSVGTGGGGRRTPLELARQLEVLRDEMRRRFVESSEVIERVHHAHRPSASNLIDYLTLRSFDLREVQKSLAEWGLSSLGRSEEHVITTLERVIDNLHLMAGDESRTWTESAVGFYEGRTTLATNATRLLGLGRPSRPVRVMVTMPSDAADDYSLVARLVDGGMDVARINCAHDDPARWESMVKNVRAAATSAGRPCRIMMDLPGPKLRTGPIAEGPRVVRLRPRRDECGRVVEFARALLTDEGYVAPREREGSTEVRVPVAASWLDALGVGDSFDLVDARGARREGVVERVLAHATVARFAKTTYVATGTTLVSATRRRTNVGVLPARPGSLRLFTGDVLTLTRELAPASPGARRIGCTPPEVLDAVRVGERVAFDDGRIDAIVVRCRDGEVDVRVTAAAQRGARLRGERGINLPDTDLDLAALSDEDVAALRFVVAHADLVGLSFVNRIDDIVALRQHLRELHGEDVGIVLKIETVHGFERLPDLLLTAMASERVGVMVARGDLAVECGFERLAEVQEEILWLCEAAHIPVIWATQVLDQMARTGRPSRAEISDVVMAGRSECVMLNKGPHVVEALRTLDDILGRMDSVQHKKTSLLRRLESWSSPRK